jgi:type IV secretion system protein VirB8
MSDKESKKIKIKSWYSNRYQIVVVQRNVLLLFTTISILAVASSVMFVKTMMSSKSLEPYVIEIDEKTGVATIVEQPTSENYTANEMMKRYFINKYIQASMAYNPKTYKQDNEVVRLFSPPAIYALYKKRINPAILGGDSVITTKIRSLLFKDDANIEVRITSEIKTPGSADLIKNEILFMGFYFAPSLSLSMEERLINPLGFQVRKFDVAEEVNSY